MGVAVSPRHGRVKFLSEIPMQVSLYALVVVCAALMSQAAQADDLTERGQYLTNILGCGGCHTEGALLGKPEGEWLAGSKIGVAYTPEEAGSPGIVFPSNLTSDKETGLGNWPTDEIVRFLKTGIDHYGKTANPVMPWPNYALLHDEDLEAVAQFLKTIPAVSKAIPESIAAGEPLSEPFVRIGVYLFVPEEPPQEEEQSGESE